MRSWPLPNDLCTTRISERCPVTQSVRQRTYYSVIVIIILELRSSSPCTLLEVVCNRDLTDGGRGMQQQVDYSEGRKTSCLINRLY